MDGKPYQSGVQTAWEWLRKIGNAVSSIAIPSWLQGHRPPPMANWMDAIAESSENAGAALSGVAPVNGSMPTFAPRRRGPQGAAGGIVVNVTVQGNVTTEQQLIYAIRDGLAKFGMQNVSSLPAGSHTVMAWPSLTVQISFVDPPLTATASTTWTDVTTYVLSLSTRRGRSDALGRIEAGNATVVLDNSDRRFDPTYASSPYSPNVLPMRKIRISAVYSATTYYLFSGFVESWPPDWPGGLDATTTIRCVDAFKYFALKKLNGPYASEYTNWSIDTWLTNIDWPGAADRELYSGQSQIQSGTFTNTPALQHFQNVADVESGLFFMGAAGKATFHNRHYRLTSSVTSQATFDDAAGASLPYLNVTSTYDDSQIWNEARVTRTGGTEQVAEDTTSQAAYFTRTLTRNLPILDDTEALGLAQWLVGVYALPIFRFTSVTLDGLMSDSLWPHMLDLGISERITVTQHPPGAADVITEACYIELIAHQIDARADGVFWSTTFGLSSAEALAGSSFWILEHSVYGVLNVTTKLAY